MVILRIEHKVPSFEGWRKAFESDPVDRKGSGVRRHRVMRSTNDPNYALIDLEFDTAAEAEAMLARLRVLWQEVAGKVMVGAQARIVEVLDAQEY